MFETAWEALEHCLKQNIEITSNYKEWQYFRETYIWKLEVNDILFYNLDNIKELYASCLSGK